MVTHYSLALVSNIVYSCGVRSFCLGYWWDADA